MVLKSPLSIPPPKQPIHLTILQRLEQHEKNSPKSFACIDSVNPHERSHFGEAKANILSLAAFLHNKGFQKGEVCSIVLRNCCQFPISIMGAWCAGLTTTPANPMYTHYELRHQLSDSEAVVVITEDLMLGRVLKAVKDCPRIRLVIAVETGYFDNELPAKVVSFTEAISTHPTFDPFSIEYNMEEDLINIPYSSGTTGVPKGVMITHMNYAYAIGINDFTIQVAASKSAATTEVAPRTCLAVLPSYHAMGFFTAVLMMFRGIQTVYFRKFSFRLMLKYIEEYKVPFIGLVPSIIQLLVDSPVVDNYDISPLRVIISGGAPLGDSTIEKLRKKFGIEVKNAYGMTELSISASAHIVPNVPNKSVGAINPNLEIKILDTITGKECGSNQQGELFIRGPIAMKGYRNRPDETRRAFDDEGFLRTGDVAYFDEKGFLYICDRAKELIKVKGAQVAPAELENVIFGIPGVKDCAVIGIPDKASGELPKAFVVRCDSQLTEEIIHNHVNERLIAYKRLAGGIEFIDEIPRTSTGKILRRKLREDPQSTMPKSKL